MAAGMQETHAAVAATPSSPPAISSPPPPRAPSTSSARSSPRPLIEKATISTDDHADNSLRRSTDKGKWIASPGMSAFDRLPDEIVQQILFAADPGSFASLVLLNSKWRAVSQQADLYAHHLALCPSYPTTSQKRLAQHPLEDLRRIFARQVKRCRFDAYLRPNRTLVRLISNSASSSSCPGGEGMLFQPSPRGHHMLAYNSSRIYVLDLRGPAIEVVRELKIMRRPAATCIRDDASVLAVLLTKMQVDLYDLKASPPRRIRSIILDNSPRAIALSPCGSVLAAAYEDGIEVSSLSPDALSTDRRAVKCDHVDALAFSFDGTQILGTSVQGEQPNTVILTAPYYDPGSVMSSDDLSALWTTSILFPNTSRDCSHAVLLQDSSRDEAFWTFAYDRSFETFRAVRIDDLRNGTTYFTGPVPTADSSARLLPCTLPSASYHGDLVSAAFQGNEIWLYGVPEDLDAVPTMGPGAVAELDAGPGSALGNALNGASGGAGSAAGTNSGSMSRANSGSPSMRAASARLQDSGNDTSVRVPQWQLLCDRLQNTFIAGSQIGELAGVSMVNWVEGFGQSSLRERLVVGAGGISESKPIASFDEDDMDFIDGGRVLLIDFDYGVTDGKTTEIDIEVGSKEPEVLEEEHRDLDTEVAIVRRRTVAQTRGKAGGGLMRHATTSSMAAAPPLPSDEEQDDDDPLVPRRIAHSTSMLARSQAGVPTPGTLPPLPPLSELRTSGSNGSNGNDDDDGGETESILEEQMAYDAPYSHAMPRSGMTLRRAATAAAVNRRHNPPPATTSSGAPIAYRRADGRREHPHESDADNWVPPPPPYQAEVDLQDLPVFLRHNVPPVLAPVDQMSAIAVPASMTSMTPAPLASLSASVSAIPGIGATLGAPGLSGLPENAPARVGETRSAPGSRAQSRPASRASRLSDNASPGDMYEATPPTTPQLATVPQTSQQPGEVSPLEPSAAFASVQAPVLSALSSTTERRRPSTALPSTGNVGFGGYNMNWGEFAPAPMSSVQTWPVRQPSVSGRSVSHGAGGPSGTSGPSLAIPGMAVPASGYPYSAPVQYNPMTPVGPAAPVPLSAGFAGPATAVDTRAPGSSSSQNQAGPGPRPTAIPRVPVGSYRPKRTSMGPSYMNKAPMPQAQLQQFPPMPQSQAVQPQFSQSQGGPAYNFQPLPQPQPYFLQSQPPPRAFSNPVVSSSSSLVEDQPLIISTPRGVSGAFDAPRRKKSARGGYGHSSSRSLDDMEMDEPKILAPVPQHPNRRERNMELRERLETISGGGTPAAPIRKPMINPFLCPNTPSSSSLQQQQSSGLNRKQSRAERSAAKNMADAKKRGWGRKKKNKGKGVDDGSSTVFSMSGTSSYVPGSSTVASETTAKKGRRGKSVAAPSTVVSTGGRHKLHLGRGRMKRKDGDVDAASSVWTDVTVTTGMPGQGHYASQPQSPQTPQYGGMPSIPGGGPGSSSAYAMQQLQQHMQKQAHPLQQTQQAPETPTVAVPAGAKKVGKCVVM